MRILLLILALCTSVVRAGQLDLAIVQFPESKSAEGLNAALAKVNLAEMTNSNRTMTGESYLKGGYVIFVQSLPVSPGQRFASITRLGDVRSDVTGALGANTVEVSITISEGVEAGLRRFTKRVYEASAPLTAGSPQVLSMRALNGRTQATVKGQATVKDIQLTSVVIGQFTR